MAKTTFRVRTKLWEMFNKECEAASIRRDAFLSRVLPDEIARIAAIPPCDDDGADWVKRTWVASDTRWGVGLKAAAVMLPDGVLADFTRTCVEKRIPRDAAWDCAIQFLTARIYEAAIVIKAPRTTKDLLSVVSASLNDATDHVSDSEVDGWIAEDMRAHVDQWRLSCLASDFYPTRLSFNAERVAEATFWQEFTVS